MNTLIRMIRANPKFAIMAASLDLFLGATAAIVVYVLLNVSGVVPTSLAVMVLSVVYALIGVVALILRYAIRNLDNLNTDGLLED